MEKEKRCPKCGRTEKVKNGFNRGKQRYKCKNCGCNYTGTKNGYPDEVKQEAIRYYLEGIGFRRIERLLKVSHVSVINWVRKAACQIRKDEKIKTPIKTDVCTGQVLVDKCIYFYILFPSCNKIRHCKKQIDIVKCGVWKKK